MVKLLGKNNMEKTFDSPQRSWVYSWCAWLL